MIGLDIQDESLKAIDLNFISTKMPISLDGATKLSTFSRLTRGCGEIKGGYGNRKWKTARRPHNTEKAWVLTGKCQVGVTPFPSSPSSLVKPHNLPITRIAPGDATSYQKTQRSTPSKLSGNRSTVRIYWGSDSISHDRSKKYFDEKPGVNGYQRLVQTTLSGGSMVDIHVQHWFIFICWDRALECLHKEKRLTLVAKNCWQRSIDLLLGSGFSWSGQQSEWPVAILARQEIC